MFKNKNKNLIIGFTRSSDKFFYWLITLTFKNMHISRLTELTIDFLPLDLIMYLSTSLNPADECQQQHSAFARATFPSGQVQIARSCPGSSLVHNEVPTRLSAEPLLSCLSRFK